MFTVIEIVLSLMVSLFIRFIQPWKQRGLQIYVGTSN